MSICDLPITPRSPRQNGIAERLIATLRRECSQQIIVLQIDLGLDFVVLTDPERRGLPAVIRRALPRSKLTAYVLSLAFNARPLCTENLKAHS